MYKSLRLHLKLVRQLFWIKLSFLDINTRRGSEVAIKISLFYKSKPVLTWCTSLLETPGMVDWSVQPNKINFC